MTTYIFRRIIQAIPLLFIISFILFALTDSLGDPLAVFAESRQRPSAAQREMMLRRLGLDRPLLEQYMVWLIGNDWRLVDVRGDGSLMEPGPRRGVLRGDLGLSFVTRRPAWTRIEEHLPGTLTFMVTAHMITLILAVAIGLFSTLSQVPFIDHLLTAASV